MTWHEEGCLRAFHSDVPCTCNAFDPGGPNVRVLLTTEELALVRKAVWRLSEGLRAFGFDAQVENVDRVLAKLDRAAGCAR